MRRWLLVLGVLVAHAVALHLIGWGGSRLSGLQPMADPAWERTLGLHESARPGGMPTTDAVAVPPPPPTVGQTVQARHLAAARETAAPPDRETKSTQRPREEPPKNSVNRRSPTGNDTPVPVAKAPASTTPEKEPPGPTPGEPNPAAPSGDTVHHPLPQAPGDPPQDGRMASQAGDAVQPAASPTPDTPPPTLAGLFWPPNTRLEYQLKGYFRGDLHGRARVQWQHSADRYQAQIEVDVGLLASMTLTSQGVIQPQRLWPQVYEENRRGRVRGARFGDQWLTLNDGSQSPRPAALQDTVSQFIQLAQDLQTGRIRPAAGTVVPVLLGRPGGVDAWEYDITGLESTPSGTVSADMWFAPSLQHLPVRIRLSLGSDTWLDLTLNRVLQAD